MQDDNHNPPDIASEKPKQAGVKDKKLAIEGPEPFVRWAFNRLLFYRYISLITILILAWASRDTWLTLVS
ncbi:MAG: hypothetical protein HRU33_23855 [Rhodobacteraceae bacterium]|nr:hypothetical protein [Paracoccaceae bacterium]